MEHKVFSYRTLEEVRAEADRVQVKLSLSTDLRPLGESIQIGNRVLPNRIALQPMEGTDGTADGAPGELTRRRYLRFAEGGAALIWFEAVAIAPEVRASAHQLYLTEKNLPDFQRLVNEIKEAGRKANGFEPMLIMQITHSGRYAKPEGTPAPLIAYNNPVLEDEPIDKSRILSDGELERYEAMFGVTAKLAERAGFDGVDVKACHRYLACELLSAYTRPGRYGGSFENRTRFFLNAFGAAKAAVASDMIVTSRINVYDGFPYPWGFGTPPVEGDASVDLSEAKALVGRLIKDYGCPVLDVTLGNPYKNPHVNRPYDRGNYVPDEHPLEGVARAMDCAAEIQQAYPELPVIGSAYSYLRAFSANLAAGMVAEKRISMAGFGRMAFANPGFANQILKKGAIDSDKVCICCGQCAQLLRAGRPAGCVVRDREVYKL